MEILKLYELRVHLEITGTQDCFISFSLFVAFWHPCQLFPRRHVAAEGEPGGSDPLEGASSANNKEQCGVTKNHCLGICSSKLFDFHNCNDEIETRKALVSLAHHGH